MLFIQGQLRYMVILAFFFFSLDFLKGVFWGFKGLEAVLEKGGAQKSNRVGGGGEEKNEVLGDGERERLRGLAGSCSSVVARERHVTCCLATLSNGEIAAAAAPSEAVSMATGHISEWKI